MPTLAHDLVFPVAAALVVLAASSLWGLATRRLLRLRALDAAPFAAVGFALLLIVLMTSARSFGLGAGVIVVAVVSVAAAALVLRSPRPARPGRDALGMTIAGLLAALAGLAPFLILGFVGVPGVGVNDDSAAHLQWTMMIAQDGTIGATGDGYPLGPHVLVAAILTATDIDRLETGFVALTIVVSVLTALVAFAGLRGVPAALRVICAVAVSATYLVASFHAVGAFKEPLMGMLLLATVVLATSRRVPADGPGWRIAIACLPMAMAAVVVLGPAGIMWHAGTAGVALVATAITSRRRIAAWSRRHRGAAVAIVVGAAVLVAFAIDPVRSQVSTMLGLQGNGNIPEHLRAWQVLGIWPTADFRFKATEDLTLVHVLYGAAVLAAVIAFIRCWRRGEFMLLAIVAGCLGVWLLGREVQTSYWVAKLLVVPAPLVMYWLVRGNFVGVSFAHRSWRPLLLVPGIVVVAGAAYSTMLADFGAVAQPLDRTRDLARIRTVVGQQPTMFVGFDYFARVRLRSRYVDQLFVYSIGNLGAIAGRPGTAPAIGDIIDMDALDPTGFAGHEYVVTPNTAHQSLPLDGLEEVLRTSQHTLYRVEEDVVRRDGMQTATSYASELDCVKSKVTATQVAQTRVPAVSTIADEWKDPSAVRPIVYGDTIVLTTGYVFEQLVELGAGSWDVSMRYTSPVPLEFEVDGERMDMPADPEFAAQYLRAGTFDMSKPGIIPVRVGALPAAVGAKDRQGAISSIVFTRTDEPAPGPADQACGTLVDWVAPAASGS